MSDVLERLKDADGGDCYNTTHCTHSSLMEDAAAEIEHLRTELSELRAKAEAQWNSFPHEEMDVIALGRFRVDQTDSNIWGWCVRAGDGEQELYKGRKSDCDAVARRLIGAFLDGAMLAHDMLAAAPSPEQPK